MWRFDLELLPLQPLRKIELRKKEEVSSPRRQRRIAQHGNRKENFTITMLAIQPTELRCRSITIDTFRCLIPVKRSMRAVHLVKCIKLCRKDEEYSIFNEKHFISLLH